MADQIINLNVVLHGLFFMELNRNTNYLEIYAPVVNTPHYFQGGVRGSLVDLSGMASPIDWSGDVNLTGKGSDPTPQGDVNPAILQFSSYGTETGIGGFKPKDLRRLIILKWPMKFTSLRLTDISNFKPDPGSVVGKNIQKWCSRFGNKNVGIAAALQYTYKTSAPVLPGTGLSWNFHFYFNAPPGERTKDVNADLKDAANIFVNQQGFDLHFDENTNYPAVPLDPPASLQNSGLNQEDELSLYEPVKTLVDVSLNQLVMDVLRTRLPEREDNAHFLDEMLHALNPVNCPIFYVHDGPMV